MLFTTPTQFIVLALALVGGWLLGLASHPGGRRWKERYATERDAHAVTRRDAEAKLVEANRLTVDARRGTDDRLIQANARIAELERDRAPLTKTSSAVATPPAAGDTPLYAPGVARPAFSRQSQVQGGQVRGGATRSWFDWA